MNQEKQVASLSPPDSESAETDSAEKEQKDNQGLSDALTDVIRYFSKRDAYLLSCHLQGLTVDEIALDFGEDVELTRFALNRVLSKVRYRLRRVSRPNPVIASPTFPLDALAELQHRLCLTSAKATEWQAAVYESRR